MTNKQHPAQFDWATELLDAEGHVTLSKQEAKEIGARLRSMGEKLKAYEDLDGAASDMQLLRIGYAAARLEIESLQARIKTMAEERADELTVAHLDGRMRAEQPAGAQQPDAAYAALSDADRDYMRKVVAVAVTMLFDGYKEDVTRVFSTGELSEFATITAAMGGEQVEDIYRRAWDLLSLPARASHGQAPAQPAPAAVPVPRWDEMIRQQFPDMPPKGWSDTLIRRYMTRELDAYRAARAPADSVLEDAARLWDAFIEAWRNEIGVDKIVNIMGGADKLKAVFLDAARKQGGA